MAHNRCADSSSWAGPGPRIGIILEITLSTRVRTFLIVDDNDGFREILRGIVTSHQDWSVLAEAPNGLEAVQQARTHAPHVVLMDVSMPVMNGIQAAKQIKQSNPATRIVLFSVYHEEEFRLKGLQAGAEYFVWKDELNGQKVEQIVDSLFPPQTSHVA